MLFSSQLWRRAPNGQLIHEGSSVPQPTDVLLSDDAPLSPHSMVRLPYFTQAILILIKLNTRLVNQCQYILTILAWFTSLGGYCLSNW